MGRCLGNIYRGTSAANNHEGLGFGEAKITTDTTLISFSPDLEQVLLRAGAESTDLSMLELTSKPGEPAIRSAHGVGKPIGAAQTQNLVAYYTTDGQFVLHGKPHLVVTGKPIRNFQSLCQLTVQRSELQPIAISSDEQWIIGIGRGQVETRPIDCAKLPAVHDADFKSRIAGCHCT